MVSPETEAPIRAHIDKLDPPPLGLETQRLLQRLWREHLHNKVSP